MVCNLIGRTVCASLLRQTSNIRVTANTKIEIAVYSAIHLLLHKTDDLQIPYVVQTCSMGTEKREKL